jgi:predicted adenine nucleotide alpha hydrolase (AANH) superfamily ATPase
MNKINYDKLMTEIVSGLEKKEKLLLHSCCAPCSTACIERLEKNFNLTIYYYNPNMDSQEEFLYVVLNSKNIAKIKI